MEPEGRGQEAPDVRLAEGGLRRVRGVAVREGHARAGAVRQRLRDGGLPEDPPAFRRLPDAPELPDQEGGGGSLSCILEIELTSDMDVHFLMDVLSAMWDWNKGRIKSLSIRERSQEVSKRRAKRV